MNKLFLPALILLVPTPGSAADPANAPTAADASAAPVTIKAKSKKICHDSPRTGSLFKEQICMTKEEWDAEAAKAKESVDNWTRTASGRYSGGNDGGGGVSSGLGVGGR